MSNRPNLRTYILIPVLLLLSMPSLADCCSEQSITRKNPAAIGGRLYDKWWAELDLAAPSTTHPAYPATAKKSGATTWRCKECHGWDYAGIEGAYGTGSHYTGIKGVTAYKGKDPAQIGALLTDTTHQYDRFLNKHALNLIATFISEGQIDMSNTIGLNSKKADGDAINGQVLYGEYCSRCHGDEGEDLNFGSNLKPEYLGPLARRNPWEVLHKIRNGHPGSKMGPEQMHSGDIMRRHHLGEVRMNEPMPAMIGKLTLQQQMDLLNYLQKLASE
ncbi:c-type cytochrome [Neptuniibacter sp. QD48_11]|uniref:c-type cytochrome n=1 Tax=Neptuniibacter sp. QD48_11 TaxID=3398211 RepID=UPI0039F61565